MQAIQSQMNVRIDAECKRKGDSVLADYGYSPSSAVRSLWSYLAECKRLPEFMLGNEANNAGQDGVSQAQQRAEEGAGMAVRLAEAAGIRCSGFQEMSYDELRQAAFDESLEAASYA